MRRLQKLFNKITGSLGSRRVLAVELELIIYEGGEISCQQKMQEDSYGPYVLFVGGCIRCNFLEYR
jgi:hypothetical protein